jgi:ATP-dependent RNA helicase DDX20
LSENILSADTVRLVVLDEADKLLEASFLADTTAILHILPTNKQVLALSATYPPELAAIAEKFMRAPQHVRPGQDSQVLQGVQQFVLPVEASPVPAKQNQVKQAALLKLLSSVSYSQCLVFSNYQVIAQSVADFLNSRGFPAIFISAGQDQTRRIQAMQSFKQFNCR